MTTARRRRTVAALALVLLVGCDQASKVAARSALAGAHPISMLGDAVRLQYAENHGGFLSLGAELGEWTRLLVFRVGCPLLLALGAALALGRREPGAGQWLGSGLVLGGGLSNLLDRFARDGAVVDFVSVGVGPLRTGIFNLADVAIVAGALVVVASLGAAGGVRPRAGADPPAER